MKKLLSLITACLLAVSMLAACGSSSSSDTTNAASESGESSLTLKDGTLMVGVEIGYPPMEYFDEDGATPIGFDIELAQALADDMGLKLEVVDTAWDGIFAGVETDKYDVILSSVSWTQERSESHTLSETYIANAPVLVVPNDSEIKDIQDLAGRSVAVQMETTADYLIQDYVKDGLDTELRQYEKVINAFDELKMGRVDAVCTDSVVAAFYLGDDVNNYKNVWQSEEAEPICMCLKKGNDALKTALEASLKNLRDNGKLAEISVKYFGSEDPINVK
ncbi:MAG: amino acid ABC transporter substrate-binding protein [Lachnospiraceae bacterium]|nr:amino acid ABC transporter substrate-binding protein [Lachnospiraceae bacterium]